MKSRKDSVVFQPGSIDSLQLKNRLVRSATFENAASETGEATGENKAKCISCNACIPTGEPLRCHNISIE